MCWGNRDRGREGRRDPLDHRGHLVDHPEGRLRDRLAEDFQWGGPTLDRHLEEASRPGHQGRQDRQDQDPRGGCS